MSLVDRLFPPRTEKVTVSEWTYEPDAELGRYHRMLLRRAAEYPSLNDKTAKRRIKALESEMKKRGLL